MPYFYGMDHKYIKSIANESNSACMLLQGGIGEDVNGFYFAEEIQYLERCGIKNLEISINSYGGSVVQSFSIFGVMTASKMNITTCNIGVCYSAGGWLWLAGDDWKVRDYTQFMAHNTANEDNPEDPLLPLFNQSVRTILAARTGKSEDEISLLMDSETFMDVSQMINYGIITESDVIKTEKRKPVLVGNSAKDHYAICNSFIEKETVITPKKMIKVTNLLKLSNEASEDAIAEKISLVMEDNTSKTTELETLKNEKADLEAKLKVYEDEKKAQKDLAALELVENAITEGKIEEKSKESWLAIANSSYDTCKTALDAFKVVKAPVHANILNKITDTSKGAVKGREDWDMRKWEIEDPNGLLELKNSMPLEYERMFNAQYKKSK